MSLRRLALPFALVLAAMPALAVEQPQGGLDASRFGPALPANGAATQEPPSNTVDPSRFGAPAMPADAIGVAPTGAPPVSNVDPTRFGKKEGEPSIEILKSKEISPGAAAPSAPKEPLDPKRFGGKPDDPAYGAFQRGYYQTAYDLALVQAEKGDAAAQTLVAEILTRGLGVPRNTEAAAKWYAKAAEKGIPEAQFQYALMQIDGKYAKKDTANALALLQKSADAGNTLAQFNLAQLFVQHDRGPEGLTKALPYYDKAATTGLPDAQYALAQIYASGVAGKKKDMAEARRYLTLAARQGYDTAQLDLGTWLVEGRGGPRDTKSGFSWLKRAAEGGNVAAMNRLAKLYMNGIGTDPNTIDAAAWYFLARRAGLNDFEMADFLDGLTEEETKTALERANRLR